MIPPLISYVTFNRLGLVEKNLKALLNNTEDDFEMHIIDSNSQDNTWEYIQSLDDSRIKSKTKLPENAGAIYAVNSNLLKRKPDQYFIVVEPDVYIKTNDWISRFLRVFDTFPEAGLLGFKRSNPYPDYLPPVIKKEKDGVGYLQLAKSNVGGIMEFIPGHCICLRPELIDVIGYWSEESHFGDAEISIRINNYTNFKSGFVNDIETDMTQLITCDFCEAKKWCNLQGTGNTCIDIHTKKYANYGFVKKHGWKHEEFFKELQEGKRSVYCASIHDPESIRNNIYNFEWARENFNYYINNSN